MRAEGRSASRGRGWQTYPGDQACDQCQHEMLRAGACAVVHRLGGSALGRVPKTPAQYLRGSQRV